MITVSQATREKCVRVADCVDTFSTLTGDFNQVFRDGESGDSGMATELLKMKANAIRNGEFKIIVCGRFKNGKSTFVNALLEKEIMAAKATACTAVIAVVRKGQDEDHVEVFYNDGTSEKLDLESFTKEFQLTEEEQLKIDAAAENGEDIVFDRFADVDHVEMESTHPMFQSGCWLIDTPGFEEALSRDKTTNTYLPNADAVVLMLNATALFSKQEKEFINSNFAGKHKDNVFFVINRVNQLRKGELETNVMPAVKMGLKSCFIDANGDFDEELYNRRVFYVNAYGALCAVTGKEEEMYTPQGWISFQSDINTTGLPVYEKAMMQFIDSDARTNAVFSSAMDLLANKYRECEEQCAAKLASMDMNENERALAAAKAKASLEAAEKTIRDIEEAFNRFAKVASGALFNDLMNYMDRNVMGEYPAHVENTITAEYYSAGKQMLDAFWNLAAVIPSESIRSRAEEVCAKHMQPIFDDLSEYVKGKLLIWQTQSGACIKTYADDLTAELNELCGEFDNHINASICAFTGADSSSKHTTKGNIQMAIALVLGKDMSAMVDISNAGGEISWGTLAGKYVAQALTDAVLVTIAPEAVLLKFGIDALIVAFRAKRSAQNKALMMGQAAIASYREEIRKDELRFKKDIINKIAATREKASQTAVASLKDCKANIRALNVSHKKSEEEEARTRNEMQSILSEMKNVIEGIFEMMTGRKPSELEFRFLGANCNKA